MFRKLLTCTVLLTLNFSAQAQHPWNSVFKSTSQDAAGTLKLTKMDSVCVSSWKGEGVDAEILDAMAATFVQELQGNAPQTPILYPCQKQSNASLVAKVAPLNADNNYKIEINAQNNELDWNAIFFLPDAALPVRNDSTDVFNQKYFVVPKLPAEVTVVRMSGQELSGTLIESEGIDLILETTRKNGKKRIQNIHKSEVFSIQFQEGEWVLYSPDESIGDDLTEEEMRIYMAGEVDAREGFNTLPTAAAGFLIAGTAAVLADGGLLLVILPPVGYTLFQLAPVIKIQGKSISNPDYKYNDLYALGYERVARPKKIMSGLKGSVLGMAAGIAAFVIFR